MRCQDADKNYTKLKKGLIYLNNLSGHSVQLVVTEAHDSFNGTLLGDTMYIGADTLNSGEWAKTLIHEYTHFSEGTAEYQKLMNALTGDTKLTQKTLSELFDKSGYGFDKVKTEQILDKYGRLVNSETPATDIDSREEIRYNRKYKESGKKRIYYSQYNTEAMSWAFSSKTKPGDIKVLYNAYDNTWNKLVADDTEDRYGTFLSIADTPENAEAIRNLYNEVYNENHREEQRDSEGIREDYERYWSLTNDLGDDNINVENQDSNGHSREVYRVESASDGIGDSRKGDGNKRNLNDSQDKIKYNRKNNSTGGENLNGQQRADEKVDKRRTETDNDKAQGRTLAKNENGPAVQEGVGEAPREIHKNRIAERHYRRLKSTPSPFSNFDYVVPQNNSELYNIQKEITEDYGIECHIVKESAWQRERRKNPATSGNGRIFVVENIDPGIRDTVLSHEMTHVMRQLEFKPYLDFVERTPDMLDMNSKQFITLMNDIFEHTGANPMELSNEEFVRFYDELNATVYGFYKSGIIDNHAEYDYEWLPDAFYDFNAYISELTEIHNQFKAAMAEYNSTQEVNADNVSTALENEVAEELTEEELEYIGEYKSELGAHLTANLLGNESFIDRITRENATVAEKILNKISDLKERFARRGNPEAIAEYKKIKKAEKLYLDAVEKAGYAYVGRKIIGSINEREEKAKFSFAGVKAKNADKLKLSTAEQMLKSGIDSETVRRETGWFKGYDGKWRFEIDDSRMFFSKNGFNPDVLSYKKLELKFIMGTITVEEQKRLKELSETVKGIHLHRLDQFVKHDALFEAYPELKSIEVTFAELDSKEKGNYDYRNNEIQISNKLSPADIKETLVHEIQHAVQHIEDFANGSNIGMFDNTEENTAYEQYENTAGEVEARDVSNRLDYDADKRKNTRPDIERENVVFVDGVSVSKKIEKDGTGKTYWHIETAKDVFKGIKSVNGLQKAAYNFILRGDKGSKIADLIDGEKLEFIRISAGEYVYGSDSKTLTEAQYKQKMRMSTSIIDLIENAFVSYDAPDHKNHKMFPDGFKNYQGRVGIDETIFKYIVRVGKAKNGMIFYDICLEVDGKVPRANRTSLIKSSTSANSISQNSEKINTFSKKSSEDIKFNLKSRDKVTRSKGEDQKFKANYTKEKVYTKKEISDKLLSVPYISTLPKAMQNEIIDSAWLSLNTIESDTSRDFFIQGSYHRILQKLWQKSDEFQKLTSEEMHEVELKLQNNAYLKAGNPSCFNKFSAFSISLSVGNVAGRVFFIFSELYFEPA